MVFSSGCYYGVLHVLDPTIRYDANGKIIAALALEAADDGIYERDGFSGERDDEDNLRTAADEIVVVETVESQSFHPDITYVSETDLEPTNATEPQLLIEPVSDSEVEPKAQPVQEESKEPSQEQVKEATQETSPEVLSAPAVEDKQETVETSRESTEAPPSNEELVAAPLAQANERKDADRGVDSTSELSESATEEPLSGEEPPEPAIEATTEHASQREGTVETVQDPVQEEHQELGPKAPEADPNAAVGTQPIFVEDPEQAQQQSMVLVADYMEAPKLFQTIQRKNWQAVLYFLRTGSFSFSMMGGDMQAVQVQAQTWVSKRDESGKELWRQLPLHAAVCFGAPATVVDKLITVYPEALKSPDCHGNLPLHLGFIFDASDEVMALMMKAYPAALHVMNSQGFQPIQCSSEISSETFQYNAELFGALSDYTRAVAENDPEKLTEQLHEVKTQLKVVNDSLFARAPPRKPEAIKEYFTTTPAMAHSQAVAVVDYGPSAFIREVTFGLCGSAHQQVEQEMAQSTHSMPANAPAEIIVLDDYETPPEESPQEEQREMPAVDPPAKAPHACRVLEYCALTKTWKEV